MSAKVPETDAAGAAKKKKKKPRKPYTISRPREAWTKEEHERFVEALKLYERDWKSIGKYVKTKTVIQIRSHAQKYFIKMKKLGRLDMIPPPRAKRSRGKSGASSGKTKRRKTVEKKTAPVVSAQEYGAVPGANPAGPQMRAALALQLAATRSQPPVSLANVRAPTAMLPLTQPSVGYMWQPGVQAPTNAWGTGVAGLPPPTTTATAPANPMVSSAFVGGLLRDQPLPTGGMPSANTSTVGAAPSMESILQGQRNSLRQSQQSLDQAFLQHINTQARDQSATAPPPQSAMPDFPAAYNFLASLFNPNAVSHQRQLISLSPASLQLVKLMMTSLASNLRQHVNLLDPQYLAQLNMNQMQTAKQQPQPQQQQQQQQQQHQQQLQNHLQQPYIQPQHQQMQLQQLQHMQQQQIARWMQMRQAAQMRMAPPTAAVTLPARSHNLPQSGASATPAPTATSSSVAPPAATSSPAIPVTSVAPTPSRTIPVPSTATATPAASAATTSLTPGTSAGDGTTTTPVQPPSASVEAGSSSAPSPPAAAPAPGDGAKTETSSSTNADATGNDDAAPSAGQ